MTDPEANQILNFWFGAIGSSEYGRYRKVWFQKDPDFDSIIQQRYSPMAEQAARGALDHWRQDPRCSLALILLLDQFPRNLYRGDPRSFATDLQALEVAQGIVEAKADQRCLLPAEQFFVYLPFEHSESIAHQNHCVELMNKLVETNPNLDPGFKSGLDYAYRHRDVIARFGRFPHRNAILGRPSTPEEIDFLKQPGSRF